MASVCIITDLKSEANQLSQITSKFYDLWFFCISLAVLSASEAFFLRQLVSARSSDGQEVALVQNPDP